MDEELGSLIDFGEDLKDVEAPKALSDNDYPGEIIKAIRRTSASGKDMAEVTFTVKPEDFPADFEDAESYPDGKQMRHYVMLGRDNATRYRTGQFVQAIGAPTKSPIDLNDWVGKSGLLTLVGEEFEGVPQERIKKVRAL